MPRGLETREQALAAATEHLRTQFARIGVDAAAGEIDAVEVEDEQGMAGGPFPSDRPDDEPAPADGAPDDRETTDEAR